VEETVEERVEGRVEERVEARMETRVDDRVGGGDRGAERGQRGRGARRARTPVVYMKYCFKFEEQALLDAAEERLEEPHVITQPQLNVPHLPGADTRELYGLA
jgi:hypothetical protein